MKLRYLIILIVLALPAASWGAPGDKVLFVPDNVFRAYTSKIRTTLAIPRSKDNLPTQFDMIMLAGADYTLAVTVTDSAYTPVNLTGYQFYAQFRDTTGPASTLFFNYSTTIVSAATGRMNIIVDGGLAAYHSGKVGVWDLLQVDALGRYTYLMMGTARIQPTATVPP